MKHVNIPIFIPHMGCPNDCVFCNQRTISGKKNFDRNSVDNEIQNALSTLTDPDAEEVEIAFFGGSFTGIDRNDMIFLLETAQKYIDLGSVKSIRLSTRPDYINSEILDILSKYSVKTIELGIQCLNDEVLIHSKRGHTVRQSLDACKMVKAAGFELVGQMMIGLPSSSVEDEIYTAQTLCEYGVDSARIYPTVVFNGTELASMNDYIPLTLDDAVYRSSETLYVFVKNNVPVIRIGLCSSESLYGENGICAGEYHSAIGELTQNALYFKLISKELEKYSKSELKDSTLIVYANKGCTSKIIGQKKCNKIKIQSEYNVKKIKVIENDILSEYNGFNIRIDVCGGDV